MRKTKKLMAGIASTSLLLGLAGCGGVGTQEAPMSDAEFEAFLKENHAKSSPAPPSSYSYSGSSTSTSMDENIENLPDDMNCVEWEWDLDDGVWECEDTTSTYYGHYYHDGLYYASKPDLYKSSSYIEYKNSSSFKGTGITVNTSTGTIHNTVTGRQQSKEVRDLVEDHLAMGDNFYNKEKTPTYVEVFPTSI